MREIQRVETAVFSVPTDRGPECDGTLCWSETTVVVVHALGGDQAGMGFTYATSACAALVDDVLAGAVAGRDAVDVGGAWSAMVRSIRNLGRPGIASMAIAAVDIALWDLKARLLDLPLASLLGQVRDASPIYGSGGFTSYSERELADQLGGWVHDLGIPRVKMKVGTDWGADPERDVRRVELAREAIGERAELYVDANGAYTRKQAVTLAARFAEQGVTWFEEPASSDDLDGLGEIRGLTNVEIAAGEYGYDLPYFVRLAPVVDVLQADVSRCAGITEWLRVATIAAANGLGISGHCAQSLHAHPACAVPNLRHLEYFHDHARVDRELFNGVLDPVDGKLVPDLGRAGHGLALRPDAGRYAT